MPKIWAIGALLMGIIGFEMACQKDDTTSQPTLTLRLTDGPASYQTVNIEIIGAEVHVNKDINSANGWQPLTIQTGIFNILSLNNGLDTLLGSTPLPVGDISEIRLKLGTNNTVKVNGTVYPLSIPSGGDSGLKLKFEKKLVAGVSYEVFLDFDAAKSIKEKNRTTYELKPVLRLFTTATSGSVRGAVTPVSCRAVVYALRGTDTVTSAFPVVSTGKFVLMGLDAGTYTIAVNSDSCLSKTLNNITVETGKANDVGTIQLR